MRPVSGRRLLTLLVVLGAIGLPAGVLQALCAGRSCDAGSEAAPRVPFCPLPAEIRRDIVDGYREGRSPDVLGVANDVAIFTQPPGTRLREPWPAVDTFTDTRVPIAFSGTGIRSGASVPDGVTLDRVAPTVAAALGFERPFPDVRSGTAIEGVAGGTPPELVLLVAWKGIGSGDLDDHPEDYPFLASMLRDGAGTLEGRTGSLPLDPTATITSIGTGGVPAQHGITGSFVRNDVGDVVPAFGEGAPVHIIATLADDLENRDRRTLVGLVGTEQSDLGLVGGGWYPNEDPVDVVFGDPGAAPIAVETHLATGYGDDDVADVIGVALDGGVVSLDRWTRRIVRSAREATDGSVLVVVAGTGSTEQSRLALPDTSLVEAVEEAVPGEAPVVAATVPGGIYLDQATLTAAEVTGQAAVDALFGVTDADGRKVMADAFQGFAVSFARYC